MALLINNSITVDGKPIRQVTSFQLVQNLYEHHYFRLVCPAESIDGTGGGIMNSSQNLIGGTLQLSVQSPEGTGSLQFRGIVTGVEADRFSGYAGNIIITGFSPTIVLDNGPHCKSWEKKAIKNIVQDVLKHFPQNLLQPQVAPAYGETMAYAVQYKQTAWQYLNFLCSTFGEWLFYDGEKLVVGPPKSSKAVSLVFNKNLSRFSMALQVNPANSQMMGYDYLNHEVYNSKPQSVESKAGLNDLGKQVLKASNAVYAAEPKAWNNQFFSNKKQLDDIITSRAAMQSSNNVRFNGSSDHPGIKLGGGISVKGNNVFSLAGESYGDYTIINVTHYFDGQGNYNNDFTAVPSSIKIPPVTAYHQIPRCETQSAIVTDNYDPDGLGRVRVKFHWMNGAEKSPWIRVTSPHGGGGKGMYIIPEIGEEAIVGFEGDSPTKPYVIGTVYHSKAKSSFGNSGNDVKAFQSRSGTKVLLNDAAGSVFVEDKGGNSMLIDGAGNITTSSKESITLSCGQSVIVMKKDGTITINGKNHHHNGYAVHHRYSSATDFAKRTEHRYCSIR